MSGIEKISKSLSSKLGERLNKSNEEIAVLNYGLFIIMHTTISIIATIIIGILTKTTLEIVIIAFTGALFKRYSGGIHASTPSNCTIIGVLLALILSILCKYIVDISNLKEVILLVTILSILSYIILYKKCPVPSKNKPFKSEKLRIKIRKRAFGLINICLVTVAVMILIYAKTDILVIKTVIVSMVLGMSLQMFAIVNMGTEVIKMLDKILSIKLNLISFRNSN
ncbi:MAG: accessory gene regulator ArgB-like protein [Peptostreptococcaceae bacterium]